MGLIHSRASKKRDKAEAALLKEQRRAVRKAGAGTPNWQQQMVARWRRWLRAALGG